MNRFSLGGHSGTKIVLSNNSPKKNINILRSMYKKEIRVCKNKLKNPYQFYDYESGIQLYKGYIKTLKTLGYNNLEIHFDAFGGNCIITNMTTLEYFVFPGEYYNKLLGKTTT